MNFRPDHHLTDLALELEFAQAASAEVAAHLGTCELCTARLAHISELQAEFETLDLPNFGQTPEVAPLPPPANRQRYGVWTAAALLLATAAAVLLVQPPTPVEPGWRSKGSDLELHVHIHDGTESRLAGPDEVVFPDDRVGFSVQPRREGFLIIAGIDAANDPYLCFPQDASAQARWFESSPEFVALDDAVQLDATLGTERLVALLCDEPVHFDEVAEALEAAGDEVPAPSLLDGCAQREHRLIKEQP
ncbi:MAG: hypothetical protein KC912_00555 [Proteobacteria bacterium]|nr:hypothetical protein [Pseudomonadota bacterium]